MRSFILAGFGCLTMLALGCEIKNELEAPGQVEIKPAPNRAVMEARPAEVGVGIKGQSLKNETGIGKAIAQPAVILFQTKEKIAFEVLIPHALELFKGSEGHYPESHEEFMDKIIKFNQIKLPKLPDGQEYRYRPEVGQLWVQPIE